MTRLVGWLTRVISLDQDPDTCKIRLEIPVALGHCNSVLQWALLECVIHGLHSQEFGIPVEGTRIPNLGECPFRTTQPSTSRKLKFECHWAYACSYGRLTAANVTHGEREEERAWS